MSTIWFKHPSDSLIADPRLKELVRKFGAAGYAAYYALVEQLYRDGGKPVDEFNAGSIAHGLKLSPKRMCEILDYAASGECGELLQKSEKGYRSDQVSAAIRFNKAISKKRRAAGKAGAQKRWRDKSVAKEC